MTVNSLLSSGPIVAANSAPWPVAFWQRYGDEIVQATAEHLYLVAIAMAIALAVALPLGIALSRSRFKAFSSSIMGMAGMVQTVPSLAMIAYGVTLLLLVKGVVAGWTGFEVPAIGTFPAVVALVLYALLPILRNTYTGIRQVDPAVIEVARGMGMSNTQILLWVQLPLALPFIMAGIRISTVWTIGVAALGGLIGAGGLGDLIMKGLANNNVAYLLAGSIPASIMALLSEWALGRFEGWLTPPGISVESG